MADANDQFNAKHGQAIPIAFALSNATTGLSNDDMTLAGGNGTLWVAPHKGSVVGISMRANASLTAGTITGRAHAAGTEFAQSGYPAPVVSSAATGSYALARVGNLTFEAGDTLGISLTTTTTLDPTNTLDIDATLYVVLDAED